MSSGGREVLGRFEQLALSLKGIRRVYFSSALTGVSDRHKRLFKAVGLWLGEAGLECYLPQEHSDPVDTPTLAPRRVYAMDRARVEQSDLVLSYLGVPSTGVGIELEMAHRTRKPVVGLAEGNASVSRIALGHPAIRTLIRFASLEDLFDQLEPVLLSLDVELTSPRRVASITSLHAFAEEVNLGCAALRDLARVFEEPAAARGGKDTGGLPSTVAEWRQLYQLVFQPRLL